MHTTVWSILLAAGSGSRTGVKKQFLNYRNAPLWWQSLLTFSRCPHIRGIVLVFPAEELEKAEQELTALVSKHAPGLEIRCTTGGARRQDSVYKGLLALPKNCTHILVHDSARPFFSSALLARVLTPLLQNQCNGVIPAIALSDTIKLVSSQTAPDAVPCAAPFYDTPRSPAQSSPIQICDTSCSPALNLAAPTCDTQHSPAQSSTAQTCDTQSSAAPTCDTQSSPAQTCGTQHSSDPRSPAQNSIAPLCVIRTLPREQLRAVQTPQGFSLPALLAAHKLALVENWEVTDDASLMEQAGHRVLVVDGERSNKKITNPEDLAMLENTSVVPCCGYGYDVHRYGGNRPLLLGGVAIPSDLLIIAHSDGDVLLHALMDALLSCMGKGDIGVLFPDTDAQYENISSSLLLDRVMELWGESGLRLTHVDLTIIAQKPKIAPHARTIAKNIARQLSLSPEHVNVKATTEEGLGFTGSLLGIKAVALVSAVAAGK